MDKSSILLRTVADELEDLASEEGFEGFERDPVEELLVPEPVDLDAIRSFFADADNAELAEKAAAIVAETLEAEGIEMTGASVAAADDEDEDGEDDPFDAPTMVAPSAMLTELKAREQEAKTKAGEAAAEVKSEGTEAGEQAKGQGDDEADEEAQAAPAALDAEALFGDVSDVGRAREAPIAAGRDGGVVTAERSISKDDIAQAETSEGGDNEPEIIEERDDTGQATELDADASAEGAFPDVPTNPADEADGFEGSAERERKITRERLEQELTRLLDDADNLPDNLDAGELLVAIAKDIEGLEDDERLSLAPLAQLLEERDVSAEQCDALIDALVARSGAIGIPMERGAAAAEDKSEADESSFFDNAPDDAAGSEPEEPFRDLVPDEAPSHEFDPRDVERMPSHSTGGRFKWVAAAVLAGFAVVGYLAFSGAGGGTKVGICKLTVEKDGALLCVVERPIFQRLSFEGRDHQVELVREEAVRRGLAGVTFVDDDGADLLAPLKKKKVTPPPAATSGDAGAAAMPTDAATPEAATQLDGGGPSSDAVVAPTGSAATKSDASSASPAPVAGD